MEEKIIKNEICTMSTYLKDNEPTYVDILLGCNGDEKRFVDLYTIIHTNSTETAYKYKERILKKVQTYFNELLTAIKTNDEVKIKYLSKHIHEAKYTKLGYSENGYGRGFGEIKVSKLVDAIKNSTAYKTNKINDILDAELYTKNIGVDIISDLITNLIQDVLGEYTEEKLNELVMGDRIRKIDMYFWNEDLKQWQNKKISTAVYYVDGFSTEYNYLLVPYSFTAGENQKQRILDNIFSGCIFTKFKNIIFDNENAYSEYIKYYTKSKRVTKMNVVSFMNDRFGKGTAKIKDGYITSKGLLDLIERFDDIRKYIEDNIKR